jgi:hypothetical protein
MTAVLGILNKQAVAIAADSAVTIGDPINHKIFNRANKIFTLSKFHPVGVMIYNSANFMGTPWETIIKIYRKQLGDKSFSTVKLYQEDFISYLKSRNFFTVENDQKGFLYGFAHTLVGTIIKEVALANRLLIETPTDENKNQFLTILEEKTDLYNEQFNNQAIFCDDFIDFKFADFEDYANQLFDELIIQNFTANGYIVNDSLRLKLKQLIFVYLKTKENFTSFSGLIFTGFGEDEIYPSLVPLNISLALQSRLRCYVEESSEAYITNENSGAIRPFAQTDVINTILTGIDPTLDNIYLQNFETYFNKYNKFILDNIGDSNPVLSAQIKGLDVKQLVSEYESKNLETKQTNYIFPLMDAVSSLSKEDLAEMAESLIYLTYLKRRMTNAEESVGGPVDVAIISKGDGFIWIKRKHYFKPELNQFFFANYFKNK